MELSKELFDIIRRDCKAFEDKTDYDVDVTDVLYSYLNSNESIFYILYDWDEGKNNDPFWDEEKNEHSAIVFIKQMCDKIKDYELRREN
jgi:hypothetical protein